MSAPIDADLIVVGGGPAGLATAIRARQRELRVVLIDQRCPPIDKACGEGLMPDGLARLQALDVELSCDQRALFRGIRYIDGPIVAEGEFPGLVGYGIRRLELHRALVERAQAVGVDLRWSTAARGLARGGVRTDDGVLRARWIVAADGLNSGLRRWAGLDARAARVRRFGVRRHYSIEPWTDHVEVHWADGAEAYVTPVGRRTVGVAVLWSRGPGRFDELLGRFPALTSRFEQADVESEDRGAGPLAQRARGVVRGNLALVGDAAGYLDAITGEGMSVAFHQAFALVEAICRADLAEYAAAHRKILALPNLLTRLLLGLERHPTLRRRVFRSLADDPTLFPRLLAIHVRALPPRQLGVRGVLGLAGRLLFPPRRTLDARRP